MGEHGRGEGEERDKWGKTGKEHGGMSILSARVRVGGGCGGGKIESASPGPMAHQNGKVSCRDGDVEIHSCRALPARVADARGLSEKRRG